jgi:glucosamine--fructose-6-phosphate aminotransferase (isomerizing)
MTERADKRTSRPSHEISTRAEQPDVMCGIFGYVGSRAAAPLLVEGLARLEYRGYDSAGVAVVMDGDLQIVRTVGRVQSLVSEHGADVLRGAIGIGHTRWATHGRPSVDNAHPHTDCKDAVAVVHNGIIENHDVLREQLIGRGHRFRSETDTEVVAHLVEECWGGALEITVRKVAEQLRGDFALAVLHRDAPGSIAAVRSGNPPLLVGLGEAEHFLGSDAIALAGHTRMVLPLNSGDIALLTASRVDITSADGDPQPPRSPIRLEMSPEEVERGDGHPHFMHKEIYEQPSGIRQALHAWAAPGAAVGSLAGGLDGIPWADVRRVTLVACGTSYHAALLGRWFFESLARVPADADISSEFRYRDLPTEPGDLCIFISQSGETADTLGALQVARERGSRIVGLCNVPGSSLTREADAVMMTATGPEIGVASTKTFTAQVVTLLLMALRGGQARGTVPEGLAKTLWNQLRMLPAQTEAALRQDGRVASLADRYRNHRDFFFLGRGVSYPVALEGALKLKEIAYVRAEAFPAGEMKHGPLALIDPSTVTVALAPSGRTRARMLATIEEVRARGGSVVEVCTLEDETDSRLVDATLRVPAASEYVLPCLLTIPLQLFAYHGAVLRGCDVDRPRNLAKSVTVE